MPRLKRNTLIAAAAFLPIPLLILGASVLCSWAVAHGASPSWRLPFRLFCHGIASRCFVVWGVPMPICARCTAIYAGLFLGLLSFMAMPWMNEQVLRVILFVSVLPLALDGITQLLHYRESTNALRSGTGLLVGLAFGMWALSAIERPGKRLFSNS
jgi:uncharacterized membrane protein